MIAVPYLRISETQDRKGQDPERQMEIIRPWAEREGVTLLDAVIDDGTSATKTGPLDRPAFIRECETAKAAGAHVVVECPDRFTRQGSELDAWARVEVRRRYGLEVYGANRPHALHGTMAGNVTNTVDADGAQGWVKAHSSKVRSGMARKKAAGAKYGRPPKPLTPAEVALVRDLRAKGKGWRRCAHAASTARGAFDVADRDAQRKIAVSHTPRARPRSRGPSEKSKRQKSPKTPAPDTAVTGHPFMTLPTTHYEESQARPRREACLSPWRVAW